MKTKAVSCLIIRINYQMQEHHLPGSESKATPIAPALYTHRHTLLIDIQIAHSPSMTVCLKNNAKQHELYFPRSDIKDLRIKK